MEIRLGIRTKILLLPIITAVCFSLFLGFFIIPKYSKGIFEERKIQTNELVSTAISILEYYNNLSNEGNITLEEAKKNALASIKAFRYGEEGLDYFWVQNFDPVMIMHPFKPQLDGTDLSEYADPDGVHLFVEFVKVCKEEGFGYVSYKWQYYDDADRIEPKLSYVEAFEPWGWIVGTGIYMNDIEEYISKQIGIIIIFSVGLGLIVVAFVLLLSSKIVSPINKMTAKIKKISEGNGDLTERIFVKSNDEIKKMAVYLNKFIEQLDNMVIDIKDNSENIDAGSTNILENISELNARIQNVSATIEELSAGLEETAASTSQISATIKDIEQDAVSISENTKDGLNTTNSLYKSAEETHESFYESQQKAEIFFNETSKKLIEALEESKNIQEINMLTETIMAITSKTNLLALNASIESARAGEAGKGFTVVADEIRKLAENSKDAVNEINRITKKLISSVQTLARESDLLLKYVDNNVKNDYNVMLSVTKRYEEDSAFVNKIMEQFSSTTGNLLASIQQMVDSVEGISSAAEEGAQGTTEIAHNMSDVLGISNNVNQKAIDTKNISNILISLVKRFKT